VKCCFFFLQKDENLKEADRILQEWKKKSC
jgi:hypothetical protein